MTIHHSIWTTAECSAWSRGFDYSGYLDLHHKEQCKGTYLTEEGYLTICKFFDEEMHRSWKK